MNSKVEQTRGLTKAQAIALRFLPFFVAASGTLIFLVLDAILAPEPNGWLHHLYLWSGTLTWLSLLLCGLSAILPVGQKQFPFDRFGRLKKLRLGSLALRLFPVAVFLLFNLAAVAAISIT